MIRPILFPVLVDLLIGFLLDFQVFQHDLDNPVTIGEQFQIVLQIAGRNKPGIFYA